MEALKLKMSVLKQTKKKKLALVFSQVIINDDYFQMSSFHGRLQWSSPVESSMSTAFEVASMWLDWDKNKVTVRWCEIILGPACVTVLGIIEVSLPLDDITKFCSLKLCLLGGTFLSRFGASRYTSCIIIFEN